MTEGVNERVSKLEVKVDMQHENLRERLADVITTFSSQMETSNKRVDKVEEQLSKLTSNVNRILWGSTLIGSLIVASQTGVLSAIKIILGGA